MGAMCAATIKDVIHIIMSLVNIAAYLMETPMCYKMLYLASSIISIIDEFIIFLNVYLKQMVQW